MRIKEYSCPNGCKLPPRKKVLKQFNDNSYGFALDDFPYCPICGSLMPYTLKKFQAFFDVYRVHPSLESALQLFYKSEYTSAAREAFVAVETTLRKKSGLDLHGSELAAKALQFERDSKTKQVTKQPLIALNKLHTESEKNEQDGIRLMLMGFFQGPRNLYQHNNIGSGVSNAVSALIEASFFLRLLDGHSITKNGHWIPIKVDYLDIYNKMPKRIDRIRLKFILKRRRRKQKNEA